MNRFVAHLGLLLVVAAWPASLVLAAEPAFTDQPALAATVGRKGETPLKFTTEGQTVTFHVPAKFEISPATIKRLGETWPEIIRVRLPLKGLELFAATAGETTVEWSVSSSPQREHHMSLRQGEKQLPLDKESPYYNQVQIVAANPKIPLAGGYFEVTLPAKLLAANPAEISLFWVDFYRE